MTPLLISVTPPSAFPFPGGAIDNTYAGFSTRGGRLNNNGGGNGLSIRWSGWGWLSHRSAPKLLRGCGFTPSDTAGQDPTDVKVEGSNNGGVAIQTLLPTTAPPCLRSATSSRRLLIDPPDDIPFRKYSSQTVRHTPVIAHLAPPQWMTNNVSA